MDTSIVSNVETRETLFSRAVATTTPLTFAAGEGAELISDDGSRYLDFISGYGVTNTGHCHPRVVAAIAQQAERLIHISTIGFTEVSSSYARRLCQRVPMKAAAKLFFTNSGTEAVEAALKLARYATGRPNLLSFSGGFHGRTMGSLSVSTSKAAFRAGHEPFVPGVYTVPYPRNDLQPTLEAIGELFSLQSRPDRFAAIIVESVLGEGGYVVPPDDFLLELRALCDTHGILLIVDEVQSGFGRTGKLFACEYTGVSPDLMTLGKGIASGLPMGALVGRAALMDAWAPGAHGNTFGGNPVVCAAATATLAVIDDENLLANAVQRGNELLGSLHQLATEYPGIVSEVRGRGLMIGVQLTSAEATTRLLKSLLERHVVVSTCGPRGDTIRLAPPLILSSEQVETFLEAWRGALEEYTSIHRGDAGRLTAYSPSNLQPPGSPPQ